MLYQIGAVTLDTAPFNVDQVDRTAAADFAVKPVIGSAPRREFMGEGDDQISLSGQLLPSVIGGLPELETLHGFRRLGRQLPIMRGDGKMMGWFAIIRITEQHINLGRDGVGHTVMHTIELVKVGPEGASADIVPALLSLFGVLGR